MNYIPLYVHSYLLRLHTLELPEIKGGILMLSPKVTLVLLGMYVHVYVYVCTCTCVRVHVLV